MAKDRPARCGVRAVRGQRGRETTLIDDGFEGATTFVTAQSATNFWFIGAATASSGSNSAYITNDAGATNNYNNVSVQTNHIYAPFSVPVGESAIVLNFDWKGNADFDAAADWDYLRVSVMAAPPVAGTFPALAEQLPLRTLARTTLPRPG